MTPEEQLLSYNPRVLIVGYDDKGIFKSTLCSNKEEVALALLGYVDFKFYWLKGSQRGCDYWKNKSEVFLKQKQKEPQKI